jgi:hypothetical protein
VAGRTANGERDLARNTREESVIYCNSGIVVAADCEMVSGREQRSSAASAGSAADGTDGAGLTSQIDVQARGEVLELAHGQESCSEIRPSQCGRHGRLIFSTARHMSEVQRSQLPGCRIAWRAPPGGHPGDLAEVWRDAGGAGTSVAAGVLALSGLRGVCAGVRRGGAGSYLAASGCGYGVRRGGRRAAPRRLCRAWDAVVAWATSAVGQVDASFRWVPRAAGGRRGRGVEEAVALSCRVAEGGLTPRLTEPSARSRDLPRSRYARTVGGGTDDRPVPVTKSEGLPQRTLRYVCPASRRGASAGRFVCVGRGVLCRP